VEGTDEKMLITKGTISPSAPADEAECAGDDSVATIRQLRPVPDEDPGVTDGGEVLCW
jgi:hypothetical protein